MLNFSLFTIISKITKDLVLRFDYEKKIQTTLFYLEDKIQKPKAEDYISKT